MVIAVHKNYQRDSSTALSSSAPLEVLLYCLEYDEAGGNNEEQTDCAEQPSAYGAYTYGDVAVGTNTVSKHKGKHAKHHCHRGPQNRTQTSLGSRHGGCCDGRALATAVGGIFRQKDGCL